MTALSNTVSCGLADHLLGGPDYARPATVHVALFTTAPNPDTGTGGVEVSAASYARVAVTNNSTNWPAATGTGQKLNANEISFGTAAANWGTVVAVGLYTASTGGTLIMSGDLATSRTILSGDPVSFPANAITFNLT